MEISNEMVRLYKEQFGRGPTKARTHWAGPDALTCFLEETLTPAERNLVRLGEHQRLRDMRMFFQYATVTEFCAPVEKITGRKVRSFRAPRVAASVSARYARQSRVAGPVGTDAV